MEELAALTLVRREVVVKDNNKELFYKMICVGALHNIVINMRILLNAHVLFCIQLYLPRIIKTY